MNEPYTKYEDNNKIVIMNPYSKSWIRLSKGRYLYYQNHQDEFKAQLEKHGMLLDKKLLDKVDIKSIYFAVTRKCNMSCKFCTMDSGPDVSTENDLTISEIKEILIPQIVKLNPNKIVVTGGEPLIRNDIEDILKILADSFETRKIILQTNGLLLNKEKLDFIANYIGVLEISTEHIFENPILFHKMEPVFEASDMYRVLLSLSFVVDDNSVKYLPQVIDICEKYNAALTIRIVSLLGRARLENTNNQVLKEKNILKTYLNVLDYIIEKGYYNSNVAKAFISTPHVGSSCGAFGKVISLRQDGDVYMCANFKAQRYCVGNIRTETLSNILTRLQDNLALEDYQKEFNCTYNAQCRNCEVFGFCPGPCVAVVAENGESREDCMYKKALLKFNLFYYEYEKSMEYNIKLFRNYLAGTLERVEKRE